MLGLYAKQLLKMFWQQLVGGIKHVLIAEAVFKIIMNKHGATIAVFSEILPFIGTVDTMIVIF